MRTSEEKDEKLRCRGVITSKAKLSRRELVYTQQKESIPLFDTNYKTYKMMYTTL